MESVLDVSTKLWTDEYQREVIDALKNGKHGKTLSNRNDHILKTYHQLFQSIQLNEVDLKIALMMDLMKKFIQLRKQEL